MTSYSQHQEDTYIANLIMDHKLNVPKFFIDIGACDGIHLSNSRLFMEMHWDGLLVEPSKHYFPKLAKNYEHRKDVKCVRVAMTEMNGTLEFSFYPKQPDHSKLSGKGGKKYMVRASKYLDLLMGHKSQEKKIGIVSIDAEGQDTCILKQVLNHEHKPWFIIIESNTQEARTDQLKLLADEYHLLNVLAVNTIWVRKDKCKWVK